MDWKPTCSCSVDLFLIPAEHPVPVHPSAPQHLNNIRNLVRLFHDNQESVTARIASSHIRTSNAHYRNTRWNGTVGLLFAFRIRFLVPKDKDGILQILQRCQNWRSFKEVLPFCSQIIGHFYILFSWISYFNITQYNIWETFCTRGSVSGKYMYQLLHGAHATKFESRYISIGIDWHQLWKYSVLVYTC